jgi:broad specificity phosphatase PhoE
VEVLLLVRHAHARSNADDLTSCSPPGDGLTEIGETQADALRQSLHGEELGIGLSSRLLRAQETLRRALAGRDLGIATMAELDEIHFGSYDGRPVVEYREWAWASPADTACPGSGESRSELATRMAVALQLLLDRPERVVLAVSHALPIRYVLDAASGIVPAARMAKVPHATPFRLRADDVDRARLGLQRWAAAPAFRE